MASNWAWYAGPCVKRHEHDKGVQLAVIAQLVGGEWKALDNAQTLFRGSSVVDLRGNDSRLLKVSDWVAFQVAGGQGRSKVWQAGKHRRLYRYADLADLGNTEQVQRRLAADGIKTPHPSGTWIVRSGETEVLQVELKQSNCVAQLSGANGKVSAFTFKPESVVEIKTGEGEVELYDLGQHAQPLAVHDWSSDEAFALRIARAVADASDPRVKDVVAWLEEHAKNGHGLLPLSGTDLVAAKDALRAGKLAKRLVADKALLQAFMDAFVDDDRVASLLRECGERVAEQERGRARAKAEADIQRETEVVRRQRLVAIEAELSTETAALRAQSDAEYKQRQHELDADLVERRVRGEADVKRTVGARKAALESLIEDLDIRCQALGGEITSLKTEAEESARRLASLRVEEDEGRAKLDGLRAQTKAAGAELAVATAQLAAARQKCPLPLPPRAFGASVGTKQAGEAIAASKLLSETGKTLMTQFLALTLAGEVPALCGPEVDDFLLIAEIMFTNGASARLEGDPTIITFEDLWLRPGTDVHTAFSQALAAAGGADGKPRTTLAVVERAERSGARFWYPTLADRARRGELPRRLLACLTMENEDNEEAREILSHAVRLQIQGALAPNGKFAAAMELASGTVGELDPGERPVDLAKAAGVISAHAGRLSAVRSLRAIRAVAEVTRLGPAARPRSIVQLFIDTAEDVSGNGTTPRRSTVHA